VRIRNEPKASCAVPEDMPSSGIAKRARDLAGCQGRNTHLASHGGLKEMWRPDDGAATKASALSLNTATVGPAAGNSADGAQGTGAYNPPHTWPCRPAHALVRTKSYPSSGLGGWARCIGPATRAWTAP
jgi:hypothetical protein